MKKRRKRTLRNRTKQKETVRSDTRSSDIWRSGIQGSDTQNPGSVRRSRAHKRHRQKRYVLQFTAALTVIIGIIIFMICFGFPDPIQAQLDIRPDQNAKQGTLYSSVPRNMEQGEFRVMLNQLPTIAEGSRDCNIQYENPSENHYSSRISLYLDKTGKLIGSTTRVDPGYFVEEVRLKQKLAVGEYPVTARIELFEETIPAGEIAIAITLRVTETQDDQKNQRGKAE